jgi:DNA-binding CsgD family transcriptional regulator
VGKAKPSGSRSKPVSPATKYQWLAAFREFGLTSRESEVMLHTVRGRKRQQIAEELGITAATVQKHVARAYEKFGVHRFHDFQSQALLAVASLPNKSSKRKRVSLGARRTSARARRPTQRAGKA